MPHEVVFCYDTGGFNSYKHCSRMIVPYLITGFSVLVFIHEIWVFALLLAAWLLYYSVAYSGNSIETELVLLSFAVSGALLGRLFVGLSSLQRFVPKPKQTSKTSLVKYVIQLLILTLTFIGVDEIIPETRFPVGYIRTLILWNGVAAVIYFWNRGDIRSIWRSWYAFYDDSYLQWILLCNWMFLVFAYMFASPIGIWAICVSTTVCILLVAYSVWWHKL